MNTREKLVSLMTVLKDVYDVGYVGVTRPSRDQIFPFPPEEKEYYRFRYSVSLASDTGLPEILQIKTESFGRRDCHYKKESLPESLDELVLPMIRKALFQKLQVSVAHDEEKIQLKNLIAKHGLPSDTEQR